MAILHDVIQKSDNWDRLRLGIPTASNFHKIITPEGKPSKQWEDYSHHLIAERWLERPVSTYTSPSMERGQLEEADAVSWYEFDTKQDTRVIGFVTTDDGKTGCSPDRLVGDDGILQIKCPEPKAQVRHILTGKLAKEHWPQVQGELFVTGRQWNDTVSWHPELKRVVIRVERDEAYIACLKKLLDEFNHFLDEITKNTIPQTQKGTTNDQPQILPL